MVKVPARSAMQRICRHVSHVCVGKGGLSHFKSFMILSRALAKRVHCKSPPQPRPSGQLFLKTPRVGLEQSKVRFWRKVKLGARAVEWIVVVNSAPLTPRLHHHNRGRLAKGHV